MKDTKCQTHTYLNEAEESRLARLILQELPGNGAGRENLSLLPAPAEMCDLIF